MREFGRYRLLGRFRTGGMADLYLAEGAGLPGYEPRLLIKRLIGHAPPGSRLGRMFITEAKLASRLSHPNIVTVHEAGLVDGEPYLALELIHGLSLREVMHALRVSCARPELPPELCAYVAREICRGLSHAHRHFHDDRPAPIIHCDVSPENVMIGYDGRVKLIDFGLARAPGLLDNEGGLAGKIGYMSPEQLAGQPVDPATDLFSLGVVLCEMLCGRRLFRASARRARVPNPAPPGAAPLPAAFRRIVRRALSQDRGRRYRSAEELAQDLAPLCASAEALAERMTLLYLARPPQPESLPLDTTDLQEVG